jgi:hypothetical protein
MAHFYQETLKPGIQNRFSELFLGTFFRKTGIILPIFRPLGSGNQHSGYLTVLQKM